MFIKEARTENITNLRNPFESWFHIQAREEEERRETEIVHREPEGEYKKVELQLKGILTGRHNLAIINNEVVGEGDVIEGKRVVHIEKRNVFLKDLNEEEEIILKLADEF